MLRRIVSAGSAALYIAVLMLVAFPVRSAFAAADTCTWTGAVSGTWSNAGNWSGCDNGNVPENGDTLTFPVSAANKSMNNDIAGLSPQQVVIDGAGYTFGGNALTNTTSGNFFDAAEDATVNLQVAFNGFNTGGTVATGKTLTFSQPVAFGSTGGQYWTGGGAVNFNNTITGAAGGVFIATNNTTVTVDGATNTFTASFVGAESNATFICSDTTCFGNAANKIYTGGGIVNIVQTGSYANGFATSTANPDDSILTTNANVSIGGTASIVDPLAVKQTGAASLQFNNTVNLSSSSLTFSGANSASSTIRMSQGITGTGSLTAESGVTVILSASNTYDGTTTIKSGAVVSPENDAALGSVVAGTTVEAGGVLLLNHAATHTYAEPLSIAGSGSATYPGAVYGALSATANLTGAMTLAGATTIYNGTNSDDLNLNGTISGAGDLTIFSADDANNGPGSISIGGAAPNTFTGTTYVTGGNLYLDKTGSVPGNLTIHSADPVATHGTVVRVYGDNAIADSAVITTATADDSLSLGNSTTPEVIGGLVGSAGEISFENNVTLIDTQNFDSEFAGTFYNDGNNSTFIKRGTGKLNLTGSDSFASDHFTYNVEGGILAFNGNFLTTSEVNLSSGATLKGTGVIGDLTTTGGTVAPGNSPGTINTTSLTLDNSSIYQQEIAGATAGSQYDQLIASGAVNLGNATLSIIPSYTPAAGQSFTIIRAGSISGTFAGLANGAETTVNGLRFRINYSATTVVLTYVSGQAVAGNGSNTPGAPNTGVEAKSMSMSIASAIVGASLLMIWLGANRFEAKKYSATKR